MISLGGFNDLIKMRDGWMVYNKNDVYIGKSIKEYGEWSQGEIDLCRQLLTPNDVIIEVGSNIGSHTIPLAKIVHKGAVFAFEPQRIIFQNLCANISINSITNCCCLESALSEKKNDQFYYPLINYDRENNFGGISLSSESNEFFQAAKNDTLDNIFANLQSLKILKIDAEGMETNVIQGGLNLIKRTNPFIYFENDRLEKSQELIELLWSLEYKVFWHIVPMYNKNNFFKNDNNIFDNISSFNMLGIKKDNEININIPEVNDSSFHPLRR